MSHERLKGLADDAAIWYVTPEFIIELKSAPDRLLTLRAKMREWTSHGVLLAWMINPETRTAEIYRADGSMEEIVAPAELVGEGPVQGFVLHLDRIWRGIADRSVIRACDGTAIRTYLKCWFCAGM